jgi:hypothetical protein
MSPGRGGGGGGSAPAAADAVSVGRPGGLPLAGSGAVGGAATVALRLEEALSYVGQLEAALHATRAERTHLQSSLGTAQEELTELRHQLAATRAELAAKTQWFGPRLGRLQSEVATSSTALRDVRMSVELLSGMYQNAVEESGRSQQRAAAAHAERDAMAEKLHDALRALRDLKVHEVPRLQALVARLEAAREAAVDAYRALKASGIVAASSEGEGTSSAPVQRSMVAPRAGDTSARSGVVVEPEAGAVATVRSADDDLSESDGDAVPVHAGVGAWTAPDTAAVGAAAAVSAGDAASGAVALPVSSLGHAPSTAASRPALSRGLGRSTVAGAPQGASLSAGGVPRPALSGAADAAAHAAGAPAGLRPGGSPLVARVRAVVADGQRTHGP